MPRDRASCACRSDGGLAHATCRVQVAASARDIVNINWTRCSTCKQSFTGTMRREVARECAEALELKVHFADGEYGAAEQAPAPEAQAKARRRGRSHARCGGLHCVGAREARQARRCGARCSRRGCELAARTRGRWRQWAGWQTRSRSAEAKLLNEKALAISTRADHITTLALRCISAWSLALKGDYADAVDETPCTRAC